MEQEKELKKELANLNLALHRSNSLGWSLLRGIFYGFGVFVGSALLVGLLLFILSRIEGWAYIGRYAHNILELLSQSGNK